MTSHARTGWMTYKVTAAMVTMLIAGTAVTGCNGTTAGTNDKVTTPSATGSVTSSSPTSSPDPATSPARGIDSASQARTDLQRLTVIDRRPYVPGYQRSCKPGDGCSFGPAWTDDQDAVDGHNSCSTRDDVLAEQLRDAQLRAGSRCVVVAGILNDPYTGATITFSKSRAYLVPLDHVVALALAWDLGAARWSQAQREAYANDPTLVLLAVDEHSNEQKSDSGPAEWMPAQRSFWCSYDQRFVTILTHYRLKVTAADKTAIARVLAHC